MKIFSWPLFVLGVWVLVSPWLLGFSSINILVWSNSIAGVGILLASLRSRKSSSEK